MKFKGAIVRDLPLAIIFTVGGRTVSLPKSGLTRLEPNSYQPGPCTIFIPRRLAEQKFGAGPGAGECDD